MSDRMWRQIDYLLVSIALGFTGALIGGGWIILAPVLNPRMLKPNTTILDLLLPCLLLWCAVTAIVRGLIYLIEPLDDEEHSND